MMRVSFERKSMALKVSAQFNFKENAFAFSNVNMLFTFVFAVLLLSFCLLVYSHFILFFFLFKGERLCILECKYFVYVCLCDSVVVFLFTCLFPFYIGFFVGTFFVYLFIMETSSLPLFLFL